MAAGLGTAQWAVASSVTPTSQSPIEQLHRLTDQSSLVVFGQVSRQTTRYSEDEHFPGQGEIIVTDVDIAVKRVLKGRLTRATVTLVVPGGCSLEDQRCFMTDIAPSFTDGESVAVFLSLNSRHQWQLSDILIGKETLEGGYFRPLGLARDMLFHHLRRSK